MLKVMINAYYLIEETLGNINRRTPASSGKYVSK